MLIEINMGEKWNLDLKFDKDIIIPKNGPSKEMVAYMKKGASRDTSVKPTGEVEKNEHEKLIIHQLNEAIANLLDFYDLPPLTISLDSVHIIEPEIFTQEGPAFEHKLKAFAHNGNIFLPRNADENEFLRQLTHEAMHTIAYAQYERKLTQTTKEFNVKKLGFNIFKPDKIFGKGFDEGITEFMASGLRTAYAEVADLKPEQAEELNEFTDYTPQLLVVLNIFKILTTQGLSPEEINTLFFQTFITGDKKVHKRLSYKFIDIGIKDGLKILMAMGPKPKDALITAKQLGFQDVAKEIEDTLAQHAE